MPMGATTSATFRFSSRTLGFDRSSQRRRQPCFRHGRRLATPLQRDGPRLGWWPVKAGSAILGVVIVATALALRLPNLAQRPMHCDEAVHAIKFDELWRTGRYIYDPREYHGPTLYYLTLPVAWASGARNFAELSETTLRLVPALMGTLLVALTLLVTDGLAPRDRSMPSSPLAGSSRRDNAGDVQSIAAPRPAHGRSTWAMLVAATLAAVSPAFVYFSRYYIQEVLLVCFSMGLIGCGWRYLRRPHWAWAAGAGLCLGCMHATKETCLIAWGCMGLGLLATRLCNSFVSRRPGELSTAPGLSPAPKSCPALETTPAPQGALSEREAQSSATPNIAPAPAAPTMPFPVEAGDAPRAPRFAARHLALAVAVAVGVSVTLFTAFFTHARGPLDSLRTYATYFDRAGNHGLHNHAWSFYWSRLLYYHTAPGPAWSEGLIVLLAAIATLFIGRDALASRWATKYTSTANPAAAFQRFLLIYTVSMAAIYTALPYKTPWCMLGFLHGMILLAGVAAGRLVAVLPAPPAIIATICLLFAGAGNLAWQARRAASLRFCADNRNPYVYSHPLHDVLNLVRWVETAGRVHPLGERVTIKIMADDYWPLPWYLRRFPNTGWWDSVPQDLSAPIVIAAGEWTDQVQSMLGDGYRASTFGLRPGTRLTVFVDSEIWQAVRAAEADQP